MRTPSRTVDLTSLGYEGMWVKVPQSINEGFVYDISLMAQDPPADATPAERARLTADANRDVAIKFLELVTDWNLTTDDDKPIPLMKNVNGKSPKDTREQQIAIVREVNADVIKAITEGVSGTSAVSERVKGF